MSRPEFRHAVWRKSSRSHGNGIEVAFTSALIGVRDSKDPTGPVLAVDPSEWSAFLADLQHDEVS